MKKIALKSILAFMTMMSLSFGLSLALAYGLLYRGLELSLDYEFAYVVTIGFAFMAISIAEYRLWLKAFPTPLGLTPEHQVWHVHVYQLFYLMIFNPIIKGWFLPVPMMKAFYQAIGIQMGDNSYTGGVIYDAHLVKVGNNCILGESTLLTVHQIEGQTLGYYPIHIGNNVTVGAHAVILPGVIIEDNAIVASGSVVPKGTYISSGEVWGGVPARRIKPAPVKEEQQILPPHAALQINSLINKDLK
jgi:acetyltransferase-like isoleucine patch superfamily enzyme